MSATNKEAISFSKTAIIGPGLIGSSMARAMRAEKICDSFIGYDTDQSALARAQEIGVIDECASSLLEAVKTADLVVLATPVGIAPNLLNEVIAATSPQTLIIDVGSVKGAISVAATKTDGGAFVPCHPVAGTEHSGPDAGFATLFKNRWCIITPLERNDETYLSAVDKARALWVGVGANVETMSAQHHDIALAVTSHLPHLIAYTLVGAADDLENVTKSEVVKYSAGGFRDFTRIASSNPTMWRDIFIHNKDAILEVLGRFSEELAVMQRAIRWGDGEALFNAFERSRDIRQAIVEAGQETEASNFGRDEATDKEVD